MEELAKRTAELMTNGDLGQVTVKKYLIELLSKVWYEGEGFSGKRPFGNSGWQWDIYTPMVAAGIVPGKLDERGNLEECDERKADEIIQFLIKSL